MVVKFHVNCNEEYLFASQLWQEVSRRGLIVVAWSVRKLDRSIVNTNNRLLKYLYVPKPPPHVNAYYIEPHQAAEQREVDGKH